MKLFNEEKRSKKEAALLYASFGWPVIPLYSTDQSGGCHCGDRDCYHRGKHPIEMCSVRNKALLYSTLSPRIIEDIWDFIPGANIGLVTGQASGLLVLDIDVKHGQKGAESLAKLEQTYGYLPRTLKSLTPTGGWHLFFRHPPAFIPSTTGCLGRHLDVRADEGYIVAPPSNVGPHRYQWANKDAEISDLPTWLRALLSPQSIGLKTYNAIKSKRLA